MPSEPSLVLLTTPRNFLPYGHSYMPNIVTVVRILLSGNVAMSSHVLCGSFTGVPHSGQAFVFLRFRHATASVRAFLGWNLLFAQHFSEGFLTFRTVEKSDFQFHSFSFFIWTPSHFPTFSLFRNFCSTFWTFSHSIFLQHSQ